MAAQDDLIDRWLLDRHKLNSQCHENHVIHISYVSDPSRGRSKVKVEETWTQIKEIGRGIFGDVWLQKNDTRSRAVKILRKRGLARHKIDYRRELEALAKFEDKSSNWEEDAIFKFFGWFENDDRIYLAMEYCEFGDLDQYIQTGEITEADAKGW